MANNRIYLRCEGCGAEWFMAKHYETGWWRDEAHDLMAADTAGPLIAFLDRHWDCFYGFRDGFGQFTLQYENQSQPWVKPTPGGAEA